MGRKEGRTDLDERPVAWEGLHEECGVWGGALEGDLGGELAGFDAGCGWSWGGAGEGGEEGEGEGEGGGLHCRGGLWFLVGWGWRDVLYVLYSIRWC